MKNSQRQAAGSTLIPYKIVSLYAAASILWISCSDSLMSAFFQQSPLLARISIAKGYFFVLVTSVLLLILVRRAVRTITRSEEKYRAYVDHAPLGIFISDEDGRFIDVNAGACRLLGYSREELLALSATQVTVDDGNLTPAERYAEFTQNRRISAELRLRRKDGPTVDVGLEGVALEGGKRYLTFCIDLTERKQLQQQLLQSRKMEALGQLAGGVAHDFNNMLQVINGHAELALADLKEDARRPALEEIAQAGSRAARLVSQLLSFSRRQVAKPEHLNLNAVVSDLMSMLRRVIGPHIRLEFIPETEAALVFADRGMMDQVLMNLCVNARDAMPDGGTLTLRTGREHIEAAFCAERPWASPGEFVRLTVSDTGCGMAPEVVERIFEPFFTTKEQGKGTGLGLATVYGIVKQHGGMIQCQSRTGQGSVFDIYLPLGAGEPRAPESSPETPAPAVGKGTILLAEDEPMVRALACKILEKAGYRVIPAVNGREAVERHQAFRDAIDLLLFDLMMPEMGGSAAAECIRQLDPAIPVIFMSGYSDQALQGRFAQGEGRQILQKPYRQDELLRRVEEALAERTVRI